MLKRKTSFLALLTALALGLSACVRLPGATVGVNGEARIGTVSLRVQPSLQPSGLQAQAFVSPKTRDDIKTLEIVPYVETSSGVFEPYSRLTGKPVAISDPQVNKKILTAPIAFEQPVTLTGLLPNTTYRIFALAYDEGGALISRTDSDLYVEVAIGSDDRVDMVTKLPVKLVDVDFLASVRVSLDLTGGARGQKIRVSLSKSVEGASVVAASKTVPRSELPKDVTFAHLQPNTDYTVQAVALDATGNSVVPDSKQAVDTAGTPTAEDSFLLKVGQETSLGTAKLALGFEWSVSTLVAEDSQGGIRVDFGYSAFDSEENLYWPSYKTGAIFKRTKEGDNMLYAGKVDEPGFFDNVGRHEARFEGPCGVAVDDDGNVYVAEYQGNRIRKIAKSGLVTTVAGSLAGTPGDQDGQGTEAFLSNPSAIVIAKNGEIYFTDNDTGSVRKIDRSGFVSTFATGLDYPEGLAFDAQGKLYVANWGANQICMIDAQGVVTVVAGSGAQGTAGHENPLQAKFNGPSGLAFDARGNLFITDETAVYMMAPSGRVSIIAGGPTSGSADGPPQDKQFDGAYGLAIDAGDRLYVIDSENRQLRLIH